MFIEFTDLYFEVIYYSQRNHIVYHIPDIPIISCSVVD